MRALLAALLLATSPAALAQPSPRVDTLAQLLHATDRRDYDPALFEAGFRSGDPAVRHLAVLGAGRIGDPRATLALLGLLGAADSAVHTPAMFALGVLGDTSAVAPILARLADSIPLSAGAVIEAPATLAKLGTRQAREAVRGLLDGQPHGIVAERRRLMLPGLLVEGWRFGREAPVVEALPYLADASDEVRWKATYLLGRTRAAAGARALLERAVDLHPWVRQFALRGLTRTATDSAGISRETVLAVIGRALADDDPGVRVHALQALASHADSALVARAEPLLRDRVPNVRLQAVTALAALGGSRAVELLRNVAASSEPIVMVREALVGLARRDSVFVTAQAVRLAASPVPAERTLAIELAALVRPADPSALVPLLRDPDPGVRATALGSLGSLSLSLELEILQMAVLELREHPDSRLRAVGWSQMGRIASSPGHVRVLVDGLEAELARGQEGVPNGILGTLRRLHQAGGQAARAVDSLFLRRTTPPPDYLLRRAMASWPELAARWGGVYPAEVSHGMGEYQSIAAELLSGGRGGRPRVTFETAGRGRFEVELLGDEAPLTVANFLALVDQGFFDGGEWHRVIPNFVVQDGAGGTGRAGTVLPIRDEFNPVRYDQPVLGMALSGPDTGTSQWFINLSPQPHLDGGYTVFGRVVRGHDTLFQILQGDRLTAIRR